MKQITLLVVLFSVITFGQIHKGMYRLGGGFNFYSTTLDEDFYETNIIRFSLEPSYSVMITDNFELGGKITYTYWQDKTEFKGLYNGMREDNQVSSTVGFGPQLRYYFNTSERLIPFVDAHFNYLVDRNDEDGLLTYGIKGGINYFFSETAALEPYIGYEIAKIGDFSNGSINIGMGFNFFIK